MTKINIASAASTFQRIPGGFQTAVSLGRNAIAVARDNKTVGKAAADVTLDIAKAGATGYGASLLAGTTAGAAISTGVGAAVGAVGLGAAAPVVAAVAPVAIAGAAISAVGSWLFGD